VAKICEYVARGIPYQMAAASVPVTRTTVQNWKARGEEDAAEGLDTDYSRFLVAIAQAELQHASEGMDKSKSDPRYASHFQWKMERRHRDLFGNVQTVEHKVEQTTPVDDLTEEERDVLAEIALRRQQRAAAVH